MSGATDDAGALLLLLAVCGDQDDIKKLRLSRIFLQQTSIHSLQRLKKNWGNLKSSFKVLFSCFFSDLNLRPLDILVGHSVFKTTACYG